MKKMNLLIGLVLLVFIGCGDSNSSGKNGNGNGNGSGDGGFSIDSYSQTESISIDLKKHLAYMGNEERLAYDIYNKFYEFHDDVMAFKNIPTKSEIKHITAVQDLIQRYDVNGTELSDSNFTSLNYQNYEISQMQPGVYGVKAVQELYDALITEASSDKISALKVACKVEVTDIDDLEKYLIVAKDENATDIIAAFDFLIEGSYKHYWAFDSALKSEGISNGCNLGETGFEDKTGIYPNN